MKKMLVLVATMILTSNSFAAIYKCTLVSDFKGSKRYTVGYISPSDDNSSTGSLAQIEINAKTGAGQPYASIVAYTDDNGKDVVAVEMVKAIVKDGSIRNVKAYKAGTSPSSANDKAGNHYYVACHKKN